MRLSDYLFIAAIVIVLSAIFFNGFKKSLEGTVNETAAKIRKAGR